MPQGYSKRWRLGLDRVRRIFRRRRAVQRLSNRDKIRSQYSEGRVHHGAVELCSRMGRQLVERHGHWQGSLIDPLRDNGIHGVSNRDNPGHPRDPFTGHSKGIPKSVDALMMTQNRLGDFRVDKSIKNLESQLRMKLNVFPFGGAQRTRYIKNLVRDPDRADIMQMGRQPHRPALAT